LKEAVGSLIIISCFGVLTEKWVETVLTADILNTWPFTEMQEARVWTNDNFIGSPVVEAANYSEIANSMSSLASGSILVCSVMTMSLS
jgi:hypothetical protein